MELSREHRDGLNVALNEATLLGMEINASRRAAAITFSVLTLPEVGDSPSDSRVQILLLNVGRVAVTLAAGDSKSVIPISLEQLLETIQSLDSGVVYGWEFIDIENNPLDAPGAGKSLDLVFPEGAMTHSIALFPEGNDNLDICVWFDALVIRTPDRKEVALDDFISGGHRWWDALHNHDPRTQGKGVFPLAPKVKDDA